MTTEIYNRLHGLIENDLRKARRAGDNKRAMAANVRLIDFERRYESDFAEREESDWSDLDPAFTSWAQVNGMFYRV